MSPEPDGASSYSASRSQHSLLLLKRLSDDIGERCVAVKDVDVEPFVLERAHRIEPFLLTRATAAHPDLDALELALGLRLAESIDDAAERLLYVGKIGNRAADDDVLDPRQRTDLIRQHFNRPVWWIAGVFGVIGQLATACDNRIGIIDAGATAGWKHGRISAWNLDKLDRALDL